MSAMAEYDHDWAGRRVLITGGAGFIGTHLVNRLCGARAHVRVLDDLSSGSANWADTAVEFIEGCVCSTDTFEQAAEGCDAIFHLAAMVSIPECERSPARCEQVNTESAGTAAEIGLASGASIVFSSSCAVYGANPPLPCNESAPLDPISAYGRSKARAEDAIYSRVTGQGLQASCLRLFNVVGPGQRPDVPYAAAVPIFATALHEGRPLHIHGDGLQTRDFVPVELVVEAMMRSAATPCNRSVNIATGRQTSLIELIGMLSRAMGRTPRCVHDEPRVGDIRHSVGDTTLLESLLDLPGPWADGEALATTLASTAAFIERQAGSPTHPPC
jgi:UDP-glucose 4-epimerase